MAGEAQAPPSFHPRPFLHRAAAPFRPSSRSYNPPNPAPYVAPPSRYEDFYSLAGPGHTSPLGKPPSTLPSNDHSNNFLTRFSMCIFLPDADDGLPSILDAIASRPDFLHQHLPHGKVEVGKFQVPRFKLSFHSSVVRVLGKLGLRLPFQETDDLSDMTEDDDSGYPLVLRDAVHKAVIEVNEEGTEAAAVTVIGIMEGCSRRPPRVDFVADHPFAYFIVEGETGAVVFAGHVLDPSRAS
uniref:Uncharacterized protein n=1 Tax=Avena sativa TaxID=4498 RepID=A0ACD5W805_AVESA